MGSAAKYVVENTDCGYFVNCNCYVDNGACGAENCYKEGGEMREITATPAFGILISILTYELGMIIYNKTKFPLFNPILISITAIIIFLTGLGIDYSDYKKGGDVIFFFLGPCTVILAVPLYRQIHTLKKNAAAIMTGIFIGSAASVASTALIAKLIGLDSNLVVSMLPKSVTTPIGIEITRESGGIIAVTVVAIVVTGIFGAMAGPLICRLFGIKNKVAVGVAIGTASHAVGTSKAVEIGETEGAMSGLSIGIAGLITVFLVPLAAYFFK